VQFIAPLTTASRKKYYQFTDINGSPGCGCCGSMTGSARRPPFQFSDCLLDKFPFRIEMIRTDNGAEFQSAFHWHLLGSGIRHVYITPAIPRLNDKMERNHRIDWEDFCRMLKGVVIDDTELFNGKLQEWQNLYHYHRLTGQGLGKVVEQFMIVCSGRPGQGLGKVA
jgi:transposase InsO family protein